MEKAIATDHDNPVIRGSGIGLAQNIIGCEFLYKLLPADTKSGLTVWEMTVAPGVGVPPHIHTHEDEAFYVIEGDLVIEAEGAAPQRLGPGSFCFGPRGVRHAFHNDGPVAAKILVISTPATSLVEMFTAMDKAARIAGGMPAIDKVMTIAAKHGVEMFLPSV